MPLTRREGVSVWRQIATTLAAAIESGAFPPGARLPTEAQLAAEHGVNRHTARRAVEELARAGVVRVEHGRGSFVAESVLDYRLDRRPRFSEWIRRHSREPLGTVLELRQTTLGTLPEAEAAVEATGLTRTDEVVLLERLGSADGRPVSLGRHVLPLRPGLLGHLRDATSITEALRLSGVPDYVRRTSRVSARLPDARQARLLEVAHTVPLLQCENVNTRPDGAVVEFGTALYPATRVNLLFEP